MAKAALDRKENSFHEENALKFSEETSEVFIWSVTLHGAGTWTLRKADQKYLESFQMRCCRRMEKFRRTDRVRNEEVLHRVKEESNILHTEQKRKKKS
jgi:predicted HD phosphohydrolase